MSKDSNSDVRDEPKMIRFYCFYLFYLVWSFLRHKGICNHLLSNRVVTYPLSNYGLVWPLLL